MAGQSQATALKGGRGVHGQTAGQQATRGQAPPARRSGIWGAALALVLCAPAGMARAAATAEPLAAGDPGTPSAAMTFLTSIPAGAGLILAQGAALLCCLLAIAALSLRGDRQAWQVAGFAAVHNAVLWLALLPEPGALAGWVGPVALALATLAVALSNMLRPGLDLWRALLLGVVGAVQGLGLAQTATAAGLPSAPHPVAALAGLSLGLMLAEALVLMLLYLGLGHWVTRRPVLLREARLRASALVMVLALIGLSRQLI